MTGRVVPQGRAERIPAPGRYHTIPWMGGHQAPGSFKLSLLICARPDTPSEIATHGGGSFRTYRSDVTNVVERKSDT